MLFLYIVIFILLAGFATYQIPRGITPAKRKELAQVRALSAPAKMIKSQYDSLPENYRPYQNILYVLRALDVKHGVGAVNDHFSERYRVNYNKTETRFTWNCRCYRVCHYREYADLFQALKEIHDALEEQRRALEVAGVSDGLTQAEGMIESLRNERDLIHEVTKELR